MKRSVLCGLSLGAVVLSLGLVGCGGGGIEEGAAQGEVNKPAIPLKPEMVDVTGKMGPGAAQAAQKKAAQAQANPGAEAPSAEKK